MKAGFAEKRKQLINNLAAGLKLSKKKFGSRLSAVGIRLKTQRAETLTIEEWQKITDILSLQGLSGFLLALAYPGWGFNLGFLVWIGFIPLFYALANQSRSRSFFTGFVAGLFYFLIVFRWLWSIYPLDTAGDPKQVCFIDHRLCRLYS